MTTQALPTELVIFDCDGVLVDSEPLSFDCLVAALHEQGWPLSREEAMGRFLGTSVDFVRDSLAAELGHPPPDDFIEGLQQRTLAAFVERLQPTPGSLAMLADLRLPRCVASSSRPERIRLSLQVTGLLDYFDPHLYSAAQVRRGKPAPDLFLHAARCMGVAPGACLVVEDSLSGIRAARAAGMAVVGFTGGGHLHHDTAAPAMLEAGALAVLSALAQLPRVLPGD